MVVAAFCVPVNPELPMPVVASGGRSLAPKHATLIDGSLAQPLPEPHADRSVGSHAWPSSAPPRHLKPPHTGSVSGTLPLYRLTIRWWLSGSWRISVVL